MTRFWAGREIRTRLSVILALVLATVACTGDMASTDSTNPTGEKIDCEPDEKLDLSTSDDPVTLHLWISNQSFDIDPVDIAVYIDDQQVVCDSFDIEDQHNWIPFEVHLDPGRHELRAVGHEGEVELAETIEVPEERWAALDFWFYPEDEPEHFTFRIQDHPVGFD